MLQLGLLQRTLHSQRQFQVIYGDTKAAAANKKIKRKKKTLNQKDTTRLNKKVKMQHFEPKHQDKNNSSVWTWI